LKKVPILSNPTNSESIHVAENDARKFSPSVQRNRDVIRDVFLELMPNKGHALEIASGSGEHVVHIASKAPNLIWHGGDPDQDSRHSLTAWIEHSQLSNLMPPHDIDVTNDHWGISEERHYDIILSINMIHIAPFKAATGLFTGVKRRLTKEGKLFLYGPFMHNGEHTSPSNIAFDQSLRTRNPMWGVRDLDLEIIPLAKKHDLQIDQIRKMPANNLVVTFKRDRVAL